MTTIAEVEDLVRRHEIDAALEEIGRMLEERPDDAEASMLFGVCQQMKGRTEAFCEVYRDLAPSMSVREAAGEVSSTVTRWRHYRNVAAYLIALGIAVFVAGLGLAIFVSACSLAPYVRHSDFETFLELAMQYSVLISGAFYSNMGLEPFHISPRLWSCVLLFAFPGYIYVLAVIAKCLEDCVIFAQRLVGRSAQ